MEISIEGHGPELNWSLEELRDDWADHMGFNLKRIEEELRLLAIALVDLKEDREVALAKGRKQIEGILFSLVISLVHIDRKRMVLKQIEKIKVEAISLDYLQDENGLKEMDYLYQMYCCDFEAMTDVCVDFNQEEIWEKFGYPDH